MMNSRLGVLVSSIVLVVAAAGPAGAQTSPPMAMPMASAMPLAGVLDPVPPKTGDSSKGTVFVSPGGLTLYTFDNDTANTSKCNGPCAGNWPPLLAPADAQPSGKFSVIARDDGRKQWAYAGKPLYLWSKDAKPGDATGDGVRGVWHAATP